MILLAMMAKSSTVPPVAVAERTWKLHVPAPVVEVTFDVSLNPCAAALSIP